MSVQVPGFLQALNHLSPIKYSIANLAPASIHGLVFTCSDTQRLPDGHCPIETGEQALELYNLNKNANLNLLALGICTIVYRVLAYLVLRLMTSSWDFVRGSYTRAAASAQRHPPIEGSGAA